MARQKGKTETQDGFEQYRETFTFTHRGVEHVAQPLTTEEFVRFATGDVADVDAKLPEDWDGPPPRPIDRQLHLALPTLDLAELVRAPHQAKSALFHRLQDYYRGLDDTRGN